MVMERTENEILIRMPLDVDLSDLQNLIDYLKYKELSANSKAQQSDADLLAEEVNKSIWEKVKISREYA
jgi:hypothetical protein